MVRRLPWWFVLVAFVAVPILEIYVLIQVGQAIGAGWTILLLLADAILGSWLLKHEGVRAWRALMVALREGRMPARELADGVLIVLGGTLMISPGFVSDAFGILCILPVTRPVGRRVLARLLERHLSRRMGSTGPAGFTAAWEPRTAHRPGDEDVVRGDVID